MPDITINYEGSTIATRSASGTTTLLTQGKYCTDDIDIVYVQPSGGGGISAKDVIFKIEPSGEISIKADAELPIYAIVRNTAITKLTLDMDTYKLGFIASGSLSGNGYNFNYNDISVYHLVLNNSAKIPSYCFQSDAAQEHVIVIRGESNGCFNSNCFRGDAGLTVLDYTFTGTNNISQNSFYSANKFSTFIIRGSAVCPLGNINAFTSATYWKSDGTGGTLYVPSSLISSYQAASNWSTILGYANNQISAIEGSIYETQYADGTPIS